MTVTGEKTHLLDNQYQPAGKVHLNWLSNWTYWWITPTIRHGYHRPLQSHDVYDILPEYSAEENVRRLGPGGNTARSLNGSSLYLKLVRSYCTESVHLTVSFILLECFRLCEPILLGMFLDYISYGSVSDTHGYIYAVLLVLSGLGHVTFYMHSFYMGYLIGLKIRTAHTTAIYQKILRMSPSQQQKVTTGKIVNLISTDAERLYRSFHAGFSGLGAGFSTTCIIVLLLLDLGWCSLVGLAVCSILIALSTLCAGKFAALMLTVAKATDHRVLLMNEIIGAIRVIKMNCWEKPFRKMISKRREEEVARVRLSNIFRGLAMGVARSSGQATAAALFITYVATGHQLTVSKVFRTLLYCNLLQDVGMLFLPNTVQHIGQVFKCLERIQEFLQVIDRPAADRTDPDDERYSKQNGSSIEFEDVSASWDDSSDNDEKVYQLRNLTFSCQQGSLVAVVGHVGSGKTSLLLHLAGGMPMHTGQVRKRGRISYSPQEPWIFHDTVRENILFGQTMGTARYREVLNVCGLEEDISRMPDEDMTLIGEKGLTLSGGQKSRISLGRAIYRDADIYLLDDPLSAVDPKVGKLIFSRCIQGFLAGKTRVLVTHQTQHLSQVDKIIVLGQGTATFVGDFNEMTESAIGDEMRLIHSEGELPDGQAPVSDIGQQMAEVTHGASLAERMDVKVEGEVGWSAYWKFFQAGGILLFVACVLLFIVSEVVSVSANWYLSKWTDTITIDSTPNATLSSYPVDDTEEQLEYIFLGLSVSSAFLYLVHEVPFYVFFAGAARNLHDAMFNRVMGAPTRFFDTNPIGIVLNRFSRDVGFVDLLLPIYYVEFFNCFVLAVGGFAMVCVILPWLLLVVAVLSVILYVVYRFAIRSFRDLKRLEAAAQSPVFSHVSETLSGLQSICILGREEDFKCRFHHYQNDHSMRYLMFMTVYRWLGMVASWILVVFLALVVVFTVIFKDDIPVAYLGLSLTYAVTMLNQFEYLFRTAAQVENTMTSVERILDYENLNQEAASTNDYRPPDNWPESGSIQMQNMSLFYYHGAPAALQDITVNIHPKHKVGVIGRTGSGKSSLLHSLMRLTEPRGEVFIDGVDIKTIGVQNLRESISVIPQDPVLFSGKMRQNLDPRFRSSDEDLWDVLKKVQLAAKVRRMYGGLDAEIYEGGCNLSVGEKQLVCLARALLEKNKILVIDEATANVDKNTDQVIQATIRLYFNHCTVLIIAHRLNTIMDCHRVMVLEKGKLLEYDVPHLLLQNPKSMFYKYIHQSPNSGDLMEIAEEAYINRFD